MSQLLQPAASHTPVRIRLIAAITLLALLLRGWAVVQLPLDYDESTYLQAGADYARLLRAGNLSAVIDYPGNREHPALVKLLYALPGLAFGADAGFTERLYACRAISALFGTLAVLLLALLNPLAGGLLAVHTMAIKYTSQAYLEALPLFAALAAVFAFRRSGRPFDRWFWLSAAMTGAAGAGKYTYASVLAVLAYIAVWEKHSSIAAMSLYLAAAMAAFVALDPSLWHDPSGTLVSQLQYHVAYTQSTEVYGAGYPWYQPLLWLSTSYPGRWHPQVLFYYGFDAPIFWMAVAAVPYLWRRGRWIVVWLGVCLAVLLSWPTKWPQYTVMADAALCVAAAVGMTRLATWSEAEFGLYSGLRLILPRPPPALWLVLAVLGLGYALALAANQSQLVQGRRGWSHVTTMNSALPSQTVYALASLPAGRMIAGTERGAATWTPGDEGGISGTWMPIDPAATGTVDMPVLAVATGSDGEIWLGGTAGLARFSAGRWQSYGANDLGLAEARVVGIAAGGARRWWVATIRGAALFDGAWHAFTSANSGLPGDYLLSLAVAPADEGDTVWFGSLAGATRYDMISGRWETFTAQGSALGAGGVMSLMIDSSARTWAGTAGGGLSVYSEGVWQTFYSSNSGLPLNSVMALYQDSAGTIWVGTSFAVQRPGGLLSGFDGLRWNTFLPGRSGFSGGQVTSMASDSLGRLWIATLSGGVDIYRAP